MADSTILPGQRAALVDGAGTTTPEFYRFFRALSVTATLPGRVDDLTVRVAKLESGHGVNVGNVTGRQSIASQGILSNGLVILTLQGDVDMAPERSFYGALAEGGKGWQTFSANFATHDNGDGTASLDLADLADSGAGSLLAITRDGKGRITGTRAATITGTAGRVTVANGSAAAGLPTLDLATVPDAGGGALRRFVRDAWGRITGTSAATTSDLAEGTNLYFTAARASAAAPVQSVNGKAGDVTLAASDVGAATTAQGAKADSAVQSVVAGANVTVDNTDPRNPVVSASGGGGGAVSSVFGRTGAVVATTGDYTPAQVGAEPAIAVGTTAQYWRGDKTWRAFAGDVLASVLTGLSTATNAAITATDSVLSALGKLQAQITRNAAIPMGYIDGLKMVWNSATSLSVTSGSAYIQSASAVLQAPTGIAKTGLSLTASTWYHVYLFDNAGTPDIEIVTTAPAAPYNGTARTKTGDTSRRYIGSVLTNSSGGIYNFEHTAAKGEILYQTDFNASGNPFIVLSSVVNTTANVSCASVVPTTAASINSALTNNDNASILLFGNSNVQVAQWSTNMLAQLSKNTTSIGTLSIDSSKSFQTVFFQPATGSAVIRVVGYTYER